MASCMMSWNWTICLNEFCQLLYYLNSVPKWQNLECSKLLQFADNNFKFDENGWKFSKQVENSVGKGEIACYKQFLLFPQCFQKGWKPELVWKRVNTSFFSSSNSYWSADSTVIHDQKHNIVSIIEWTKFTNWAIKFLHVGDWQLVFNDNAVSNILL